MSKLIVPSQQPNQEKSVVKVTPESANWGYVGFEVYTLAKGDKISMDTGEQEVCIVLLSGYANARTKQQEWNNIGQRMHIFEEIPPYAVYVPSGDQYEVEALTDAEIAVCTAPGKGTYEARLIAPKDIRVDMRGSGKTLRRIHNILPEDQPADSLLIVEVYTPNGNWSSYPPHKHDQENLPNEAYLEETYYHRIKQANGFALQRVYTDDRSLNETMVVKDGDVVLVPKGYHPVSAPPGYDLYYLNTMAGPVRTWKFTNDADHEWMMTQTV
ncbi:5-deoxy-glucuronate isomerase [Brevibacillus agri]|uniref:5-deoxy-glucuronate isomerase n=1 Tax=Brevibacillus TaxID=55080 RepID=UPI0004259B58|nr:MULTISPECIES: 5-deoxy-glucuronate isomerase [Brevibacillus]MBY0052164.1 5-deoxy-glucuronate isomerase [Brevibacillus agri]MCG5252224.1 5-deoxy-glucuronate isomerase [Brevibacillus agri]MDN4093948.1 5-deoxy-glucuronate isomerase [Brevibacillus agri]MED1645407.1 5-deoxy-glucuronate isomerase [Brevibacillus agri]MED1655202.1 5-deoxy-glucuronate isomerase [Brevibacillus agri]